MRTFAVHFDFPKVVSANNVLKQMRRFRKRAPLSIFWEGVLLAFGNLAVYPALLARLKIAGCDEKSSPKT
jgi:hypothetical protein